MENMNITSAHYVVSDYDSTIKNIVAVIGGQEIVVPLAPGNRHYDEILRQVAAGDLTIADAD